MTIAFQGEIGAYSEEAAHVLYEGASLMPCSTFAAVFKAVESGEADRGVIPIENSLFGSIHVNYDLMRAHTLRIVGEVHLRVRHYLLALQGVTPDQVRQVFSHPQALGQCETYLQTELPGAEAVPAYDTAGAARMIAREGRRAAAAIASRKAAEEYGLAVLAEGIESNHQNYTRFLSLARPADVQDRLPEGSMKTSIVYAQRENVPGGLFKSLSVFALRDIDLHKIESRPQVGSPGRYLFYLDLEGSVTDPNIRRALDHLEGLAAFVRVLGSYPQGAVVG